MSDILQPFFIETISFCVAEEFSCHSPFPIIHAAAAPPTGQERMGSQGYLLQCSAAIEESDLTSSSPPQ